MFFCRWKKCRRSLQTPHNGKKFPDRIQFGRRTSLCTSRRGSLTLEAALVLPFFLCAVAALICLFSFSAAYAKEERSLMEKAQTLAAVGQGDRSDPYILLYKSVPVELPFPGLFHNRDRLLCKASVRSWIGYTGETFRACEGEELVYVTPRGTVYHRNRNCTYLRLSVRTLSSGSLDTARNLSGGKYVPCEYCIKGHTVPSSVYITDYGTGYHSSRECQGLKRTIMAVPLSKVEGLRRCYRCGSS